MSSPERPSQWGDKHWTHRMPERVARGEQRYNARLTTGDVRAMRLAYVRLRLTGRAIADRWNIDPKHAYDVLSGRKWKHVPGAVTMRSKGRRATPTAGQTPAAKGAER